MTTSDQKRELVCFHEAGHAVAARLCGLPINFVEIDLSASGKLGEVNSLFGESHHLHYHSMFHHLSGPLAEKFATVQVVDISGIRSLKDVVQATILMQRLFVQDLNSPVLKAQLGSSIPNAFFGLDHYAFITNHLNQVCREIESYFSQPSAQQAINSFARELIDMGDGRYEGKKAESFIDEILGPVVSSVRVPDWYYRLCKENPNIGWDLTVEEQEWEDIKNGVSRYDG